jgi:hypothetical protein
LALVALLRFGFTGPLAQLLIDGAILAIEQVDQETTDAGAPATADDGRAETPQRQDSGLGTAQMRQVS